MAHILHIILILLPGGIIKSGLPSSLFHNIKHSLSPSEACPSPLPQQGVPASSWKLGSEMACAGVCWCFLGEGPSP